MDWRCEWDAGAGFEAARRLRQGPERKLRLHGHSFGVHARAAAADGTAEAWGAALAEAVAPLDHRLLDEIVGDPADAPLAGWIAARLPATPSRLVLHAGAAAGAAWTPARASHWRRYRFEAAHRLPRVGPRHKCGRMHGHGFAVLIECDAAHSHEAIDDAWAPLHVRLAWRCLNEIEGLENPTSEVLAAWIWRHLARALPGLERVTVYETASSAAVHDGTSFRIWKQCTLDSAVADARGLHGHTYQLRLHLMAPLDEVLGWVVDFGDVKQLFHPLFEQLDHHPLHELPQAPAPDCAALAAWIAERTRPLLPALARIDLHATPEQGAVLASAAAAPGG